MKQKTIHLYHLHLPRIEARMQELVPGGLLNEDAFVNFRLLNTAFEQAVLEAHTNQVIEASDLLQDRFGKPYLNPEKFPKLHFNKSNTKEHLVMAVAEFPLGIDLEMVQPSFRSEILPQLVHPNDSLQVKDAKDFYVLWSIKEAVVKYLGLGLQIPMKDFSIVKTADARFEAVYEDKKIEIHAVALLGDQSCYIACNSETLVHFQFSESSTCEVLVLEKLKVT